MALYVVDTNIIVSGVITAGWSSPPGMVVEAMLRGRLAYVLSGELLAEYRRVLLRPRIAARHGWSASPVDTFLRRVVLEARLRYVSDEDRVEGDMPPTEVPGDAHVLRLLAHEPRSALVSGDRRLVAAVEGWRPVLAAAELAVRLA